MMDDFNNDDASTEETPAPEGGEAPADDAMGGDQTDGGEAGGEETPAL